MGSLEVVEVLTLRMGGDGWSISELCRPKTKLGEATDHVMRGCNRYFHGGSELLEALISKTNHSEKRSVYSGGWKCSECCNAGSHRLCEIFGGNQ